MAAVFVIGSINMDVVALAERHPRPGETVRGSDLRLLPGGKGANQAVAAVRAGAITRLVGRLGEDPFGAELRTFLTEEGLDLTRTDSLPGVPTGTALITVAQAENTIVVVPGANDRLRPGDVDELDVAPGDIVVAQFEIRQETVLAAFERAKRTGGYTVLNPAPAAATVPALRDITDVWVVNESELSWLVAGASVERMTLEEAIDGARLLQSSRTQSVIVTLGAQGAVALHGDKVFRAAGHMVTAVDTTGAGDCFVGNFAAGIATGRDFETSVVFANRAASLCVQVLGASRSMPRNDATETALSS
jgi:ribokinase